VQAPAQDFRLFGWIHCSVIAMAAAAPFLLAKAGRPTAVRKTLAILLATNELIWYTYRYSTEGWRWPEGLPLQLCDVVVWVTVAAAWTAHEKTFEMAWFWGVAGAGMAILTPDLWAPCWSYPTFYFFMAHCLIVTILLYMVIAEIARPALGAPWRAFLGANAYVLIVGAFNAIFKTNYMYLCRKPEGASILDWFGPWPWYILGGEAAGFILFWLLWLPFRYANAHARRGH